MSFKPSATSTLHMSAANPATFDATGYNALSWTLVGEITDIGEFGRAWEIATHNPLNLRGTQKTKTSFNEGSFTVQMALDTDDAGQIIGKAASLSQNQYSVKITTQNGDKYNMQVLVTSFLVGGLTQDGVTTGSMSVEITSTNADVGIVEILAP